jgi:hypothetical protein
MRKPGSVLQQDETADDVDRVSCQRTAKAGAVWSAATANEFTWTAWTAWGRGVPWRCLARLPEGFDHGGRSGVEDLDGRALGSLDAAGFWTHLPDVFRVYFDVLRGDELSVGRCSVLRSSRRQRMPQELPVCLSPPSHGNAAISHRSAGCGKTDGHRGFKPSSSPNKQPNLRCNTPRSLFAAGRHKSLLTHVA